MIGASDIILIIVGAVLAVLGYFVKVIHTDVRNNTREVGENRGMIHNNSKDIEHEREMRNQSLKQIFSILNEIKEDIKNIRK